jgi:hypothetical protein
MAKKRRMRKLAAMEAAKKEEAPKVEAKPVVEATPEPAPAPVAVEEQAVEEKPKKTKRLWSRKTTTEE